MARTKVSATALNRLLQERAANTPECAQCVIGNVVETIVDETGCNWRVSRIQGSGCIDCLEVMGAFVEGLRAEFLLDLGNDMDPTLLTTWAMR